MQAFNLLDQNSFESWAKHKRSLYSENRLSELRQPVRVNADGTIPAAQIAIIGQRIRDYNLVFYRIEGKGEFTAESIAHLSAQLGLMQLDKNLCAGEDCLSMITDSSDDKVSGSQRQRYIPYSNSALSWHTDGYYNPYHQRVQAFILHCRQCAEHGGENRFLDPEIVYLLLREQNPAYIEALCHAGVMQIPPNQIDQDHVRPATSSSVFQISQDYSQLDMRFSQRKRHIIWRDDERTQAALNCLNDILEQQSRWQIDHRLQANEGVICNNVLHCRQAYEDASDSKRLLLRARYYNRINLTAA